MTVVESLKARWRFLLAGLVSFIAALALMRWGEGAPLLQGPGDIGVLIGFAMVALFFVLNDTRGGGAK